MKTVAAILSVASVLVALAFSSAAQAQVQRASTPMLHIPSAIKGTFDERRPGMPTDIDKGAKGGPADTVTIDLGETVDVRIILECDSCLPRLAVQDPKGKVVKRASGVVTAQMDTRLTPGTWTIWVGSSVDRGGDYEVTVSNEDGIEPKLAAFSDIEVSYQSGTKTVKYQDDTVRVGSQSVTIQDFNGTLIRTIKFADITGINSSITSTSNQAAAVLFGPAFAGSSHQQWVTIQTVDKTITLSVPAKVYPMLLAELQRVTAKK